MGVLAGGMGTFSRRDQVNDRGRDDCIKVAPPSEPDRRVSRIRLSRRVGSNGETEDSSIKIGYGAIGRERELWSG
jgi:hypothetical protein